MGNLLHVPSTVFAHHLLADLPCTSGVRADFSPLEVPAEHADDCCKYCRTDE